MTHLAVWGIRIGACHWTQNRFIFHHDFWKCCVPVNTKLECNYIFPNYLASNRIQFGTKPVWKALSVVVSTVEYSFSSVKLLSNTGSGVNSLDLFSPPLNVGPNIIWQLNCIQRQIISVELHSYIQWKMKYTVPKA